MNTADTAIRTATIRAYATRLIVLDVDGGDPSSLYAEIHAAGLTNEVAALLKRQARGYDDHADALARERRDRIMRVVK